MPEAVGWPDYRWYYMTDELISLVDQACCGHVSMVAKELDTTGPSENARLPVCY